MSEPRILRRAEVIRRTGLAKATLYRMMAAGQFPCPVQLSQRCVGWHLEEINTWIESRERAGTDRPARPSRATS